MEWQNVTISVPKPLLKKAKILAATMDKSLSELLRESLEQKIKDVEGFNTTKVRQLKLLKNGLNLGTNGNVSENRDQLYE